MRWSAGDHAASARKEEVRRAILALSVAHLAEVGRAAALERAHRCEAVGDPELPVRVLEVLADGGRCHDEPLGDLGVGETCRHHPQDAPLLRGERERRRRRRTLAQQPLERRGDEMAELSARLFDSDDAREAMLAFLSKR